MELIVKPKNTKQEKSLLEFLQSKGITYAVNGTVAKKAILKTAQKNTEKKVRKMKEFLDSWNGLLKGVENSKDEKVQRILAKHK